MQNLIRGIHHTAISTRNLTKSMVFYRDILGFKEVIPFDWDQGNLIADKVTGLKNSSARSVMLKAGNTCIELFEFINPSPKETDVNRRVCDYGISHIALEVDDIDVVYTHLAKSGMKFNCPPQELGNGIKVTYGKDPDGNVVELVEKGIPSLKVSNCVLTFSLVMPFWANNSKSLSENPLIFSIICQCVQLRFLNVFFFLRLQEYNHDHTFLRYS